MSDFLLDFRGQDLRRRSMALAARELKFFADTQVQTLDHDGFSLVITRADDLGLWGPYVWESDQGRGLAALAGRIALAEEQWEAARRMAGPGGLACKAIFNSYRKEGERAFEKLNGNFAVILYDPSARQVHLATDRCGMYLAYGQEGAAAPLVYGSHPDVLAAALGEAQNWDMTSLSEFLMTTRLSFPYTYYRRVRGLEPGYIHTFNLQNGAPALESSRQYFRLNFKVEPAASEWDLAEALSSAFRGAVARRTQPFLGKVGVALSGGLDSRALLAAAGAREHIRAFTLFDEENAELKAARAIAAVCGVELVPIRREFDYYGNAAELAVRISGGTGPITCNHFLGARERLKDLGVQNLLTGCYCDYLLKGLAVNTVESKLTRRQSLGPFQLECYERCSWFESPYRAGVLARLHDRFPEVRQGPLSEADWLNVERKRTFPLAYEVDLAQRVIPQRVMPWYVPIVDNEIIETYLRIPSRYKLNASIFKKMLRLLGPEALGRIPDSNTGAALDASWPWQALCRYGSSLRHRLNQTLSRRMATSGSWPNFHHYFLSSKVIQSLWTRPNPVAAEVLGSILGQNPFDRSIREHVERHLGFFFNLFTQKLWLDQRAGVKPEA
jgi:asparagine synthase (glutamine-hydrolysing)